MDDEMKELIRDIRDSLYRIEALLQPTGFEIGPPVIEIIDKEGVKILRRMMKDWGADATGAPDKEPLS